MRISFNSRLKSVDTISGINGYGTATVGMLKSLQALGYRFSFNDPRGDVQINFDQPQHWKWYGNGYRIGYHPWESTLLQPGWSDYMNEANEIWTPSELIAGWYKKYNNITVPVHVYEHGIEHSWEPRRRKRGDKVRFLMVGAEATRKYGWNTIEVFREAFEGIDDVELTLKTVNSNWNQISRIRNINFLDGKMELRELQNLFYEHDVYVYLSAGEGFGLTPLQAMATGMPTVCVNAWAPYDDIMDPTLKVASTLKPSPWPDLHPGLMFRYDHKDAVAKMRTAYHEFESVSNQAFNSADYVHERYDWDALTKETFFNLENRLKSVL